MKYRTELEKAIVPEIAAALRENPARVVAAEEKRYKINVEQASELVLAGTGSVILLCGPSSSGKTTSAYRLAAELEQREKKAKIISLDNFYKPHAALPHWPDGTLNFESVDGLDIDCMVECLETLWKTGTAQFPAFDFKAQTRSEQTERVDWDEQTYLIFEGIHALNPKISGRLPCAAKIYVSLHSDFVDPEGNIIIGAREMRLVRRIVRDYYHRNSSVQHTLSMWGNVLRGEEIYMRPYRTEADIHINTAHSYEPFLYRDTIFELLSNAGDCGDYRFVVNRLISAQRHFFQIPQELIPATSLIQEFLH